MTTSKWLVGASVAAAVAAIGLYSYNAKAADLKGDGLGDLEERVAELEATVARKGNRKVKLTISGEISKALLWTDGLGLPDNNKARVIDNANSGTKVRLTGEAAISAHAKAGFIFEYGFDETKGMGLGPVAGPLVHYLDGDAQLRKSAVWVETAIGRVTVGKFSLATDGITEIDVSNTGIASRMMSVEPIWSYLGLGGLPIVGGNLLNPTPFHDLRAEVVRYDSPTLGGLTASASWGGGQTASGDNLYDVALRWFGEGAGFRVAVGAGYRVEEYKTFFGAPDQKTLSGSASAIHSASGIFATVAAADQKDNPIYGHIQMVHGKVGLERNWFGIGATSVYGEYAEHQFKDMNINSSFYGGGVVQAVDAAAIDFFVSVRQYKSDVLSGDATVGLAGARIKF